MGPDPAGDHSMWVWVWVCVSGEGVLFSILHHFENGTWGLHLPMLQSQKYCEKSENKF